MLHRLKKLIQCQRNHANALPYNHVALYSWEPANGQINFGDHLSKIIASQVLSTRGLSFEDETTKNVRMLSIGSILHYAKDGDTIWGSGINGKVPADSFKATKLDIRSVRGPHTAKFLKERGHTVPEIYGDPALLLPTLFEGRFQRSPIHDYVFVPNLHDLSLVSGQENVISPLLGWNRVVEEILKAKFVLASSLHGLVVAEAFGIPARYVRLSEEENIFKYEDYFFGTGREGFGFATSIQIGLDMGGMKPINYNPEPLINAFPWDLWE